MTLHRDLTAYVATLQQRAEQPPKYRAAIVAEIAERLTELLDTYPDDSYPEYGVLIDGRFIETLAPPPGLTLMVRRVTPPKEAS